MSQGIHKWKVKLTGTSQTFVKEIGITSNLKDILRINKSEEVLEEIGRFREIRREVATCFYYDGNQGDIVSNSCVQKNKRKEKNHTFKLFIACSVKPSCAHAGASVNATHWCRVPFESTQVSGKGLKKWSLLRFFLLQIKQPTPSLCVFLRVRLNRTTVYDAPYS